MKALALLTKQMICVRRQKADDPRMKTLNAVRQFIRLRTILNFSFSSNERNPTRHCPQGVEGGGRAAYCGAGAGCAVEGAGACRLAYPPA